MISEDDYKRIGERCVEFFEKNGAGIPPSTLPRVVSFVGAIGSGKSTAANILVEQFGYTRIRFAGPLKDMLRAIGLSDEELDGPLKEGPSKVLGGLTPRRAMQSLGTEWGRVCMYPNFWLDLWLHRVNEVLEGGGRVVVDDCRFLNEDEAIRGLGGVHVRLIRRSTGNSAAGAHVSESYQVQEDVWITNSGTQDDLSVKLRSLLDALAARPAPRSTPYKQ